MRKKFKMADWQSPPENQLKRHVLVWVTAALLIKWKVNLGNFPANSETGTPQQTHQRWINVEATLIVNVHQRFSTLISGWKWKLSRRTFIHVFSTLTKQRWNNVDRITSIQRRWTKVFQRWNLIENQSWADVCLSTFQRCQNNVETTLTELQWFNADNSVLFHYWY